MPKPILAVDDAHESLSELAELLGTSGYAVSLVTPSEDPVAHFTALEPELVFVSLDAPAPTQACEAIRADPDGAIVPIVLVGKDHPAVRSPADALNAGADFYFERPVDRAKVLAKVRTYIGKGDRSPQPVVRLGQTMAAAPAGAAQAEGDALAVTADAAGAPEAVSGTTSAPSEPAAVSDAPLAGSAAAPPLALAGSAAAPPAPLQAAPPDAALTSPPDRPGEASGRTEAPAPEALLRSSADALLAVIASTEAELGATAPGDPGGAEAESSPERPGGGVPPEAVGGPRASDAGASRADEPSRRTEREAWRHAEQEVQRQADEEARRRVEDELETRAREESRRRLEEETRRRLEEETRRRLDEEARRRLDEEARRRADEELRRQLDDDSRRRIEEETRRRLEEEARRRDDSAAREAELRRRVEEELRREMGLPPAGAGIPSDSARHRSSPPVVAGPPPPAPLARAPRPVPAGMTAPDPAAGSLDGGHDVATLLFELSRQQVTGRVDFASDGRQKSVFFERGAPVDAYSSQVHDRIEEYLLREGRITRSQYQDVRAKGLRGPRRIAAHLASEGFLKPEELFGAVRGHLQETLYGLFEWEDGTYAFVPERAAEDDRVSLETDVRAVILEGIRRKYLLPRMMARIGGPSSLVAVRVALAELEPLRLMPEEREAARLTDGTRSLEDVVFTSGLEPLRVYHVATALVAVGLAEVAVRGIEAATRAGAAGADAIDRGRIGDKLEQVRNLDYFQVLGVSRSATPFEIDRAFERARGEFHPARFSAALQEALRDELAEIEQVLEEARLVLRDERLRDSYARHAPV